MVVYVFVHRVTASPLGRALRAIRDNEAAAAALGKDVMRMRLFIFVMGNVIAGISGAVLVEFIGAWSPGSWLYVETFVLFTAIIVGGTGNNAGVMVGALLVPVAFNEATRYLPQIGRPGLIDALQWIVIGLLALVLPVVLASRTSFPSGAAAPASASEPTRRADDARHRLTLPRANERSRRSGPAAAAARRSSGLPAWSTDLRRDFGGVWAVDGATFSVGRGSITSLIGPERSRQIDGRRNHRRRRPSDGGASGVRR